MCKENEELNHTYTSSDGVEFKSNFDLEEYLSVDSKCNSCFNQGKCTDKRELIDLGIVDNMDAEIRSCKSYKERLVFENESKQIKAATYDPESLILTIDYGKADYNYFEVPEGVIKPFTEADSPGSFAHNITKQNFRCEKVV